MKIKKTILAILAVFAFSACSNEELSPTPYTEGKAEGYLILNLEDPVSTKTSTSGNTATDGGTIGENTISKLTVVLANEAGDIHSVVNPAIANKVSEAFRVEVGTYYVYALINSAINVEVGQNIERVITVAAAAEATSGYKGGSFFMVNKRNGGLEKAGVKATITTEKTKDDPAKVKINVDRMACKITDETETPDISVLETATDGIIDEVEVVGFALLNVNKQFNLIQTWNDDNGGGMNLTEEVLSTPLYPNGGEDLVANQYFHNIGEYTTLIKNEDGNIIAITDNTTEDQTIFVKGSAYTTENRPTIVNAGASGITAGRGETTGVIYKVQAKKGGNNSGTFFKYKDVLYSDIAAIQALDEFEGQTLPSEAPALRALGINVYENGVIYYTYFIRDPNAAHQYGNLNYYGVFRNSSYKLAINKITSLGDDVPGGTAVDPSKPGEPGNPPIDTAEAYLQVSIEVNRWVVSNIDIDF